MEKYCKKSDKSWTWFRNIIILETVLIVCACSALAVFYFVTSWEKVYHPMQYVTGYYTTEVYPIRIMMGVISLLGGSLGAYLFYKTAMFFLWIAYDVKVIRSACMRAALPSSLDSLARELDHHFSDPFSMNEKADADHATADRHDKA